MIKVCKNIDDISLVWSEAFGDSYDDIKYFYDSIKNGICLAYYDNEKICSLLYLVDCSLKGKEFKYAYAVCTLNEKKRMGYVSSLLKYISYEYSNICLIPANENLVDFYKKRGYKYECSVDEILFFESDELVNDYLLVGCELEKPIILSTTEV